MAIGGLLSIIPIEPHGMSIFTVLAFVILAICCYFIVLILCTKIKNLRDKGILLKNDFEKSRDKIHEKIDSSFSKMADKIDILTAGISELNSHSSEHRANDNNIAKNIDDIKKDFRDFKNRGK